MAEEALIEAETEKLRKSTENKNYIKRHKELACQPHVFDKISILKMLEISGKVFVKDVPVVILKVCGVQPRSQINADAL